MRADPVGCPGVEGPFPQPVSMSRESLGFAGTWRQGKARCGQAAFCANVLAHSNTPARLLMKAHRSLSPRQEALAERSLITALMTMRTPEECRAFLKDLCTPAELQAMADRWAVVEALQQDLPYREIHRLTGVSLTTIGRVARYMADGNGGYALAVDRLGSSKHG